MQAYVRSLKSLFEKNANPADAAPMKKYMRDQFEFLGIKTPVRRWTSWTPSRGGCGHCHSASSSTLPTG